MDENENRFAGQCPRDEELASLALPQGPWDEALRKHVDACSRCAAKLARLREIDARIRNLLAFPPPSTDPNLASAHLDGRLEGPEKEAFEAHLASCPSCDEERSLFRENGLEIPGISEISEKTLESVKRFAQPETEVAPAPADAPLSPAATAPPAARPAPRRFLLAVAAVAAGFLVALGLFRILDGNAASAPAETAGMFQAFPPAKSDRNALIRREDPSKTEETPAEKTGAASEDLPDDDRTVSRPPEEPREETPQRPEIPEEKPKETVEKPDTPPDRTRERSPAGPAEESGPPDETGGAETRVPSAPPTRLYEVEVSGDVSVRTRRSTEWSALPRRAAVETGWALATSSVSLGRVAFPGVGEILLRADTRIRILAGETELRFRLDAGETIVRPSSETSIEAVAGSLEACGTRNAAFGLVAGKKIEIYVLEGEVHGDAGATGFRLDAGRSLALEQGGKASDPKNFDLQSRGRWAAFFQRNGVVLLQEDFETPPRGWNQGRFQRRVTFRHSRGALHAVRVRDAELDVAVSKVNGKPLFAARKNIQITMACLVEGATELLVRLWRPRTKSFLSLAAPVEPGGWKRVTLGLGRAIEEGKVEPGEAFTGVHVGASGDHADFWIDDFTIQRIPGPQPVRIEGLPTELPPACSCAGAETSEACRVARIIEMIRTVEKMERAVKEGGTGRSYGKDRGSNGARKPAKNGERGDGDGGSGSGEDAPSGPSGGTPPASPPGPGGPKPPGNGDGPVPPMPPAPFPGGGPPPPAPPDPRPAGEPGAGPAGESGGKQGPEEGEEEGKPGPDAGTPEKPGPRLPGAQPTSDNLKRFKRWLREQLPLQWPPYPGWKPLCRKGRNCKCLRTVKKYLHHYRLGADE